MSEKVDSLKSILLEIGSHLDQVSDALECVEADIAVCSDTSDEKAVNEFLSGLWDRVALIRVALDSTWDVRSITDSMDTRDVDEDIREIDDYEQLSFNDEDIGDGGSIESIPLVFDVLALVGVLELADAEIESLKISAYQELSETLEETNLLCAIEYLENQTRVMHYYANDVKEICEGFFGAYNA